VSLNTIAKPLADAGLACARFHDENVRGVKAKRVQCDEIRSFCYAKAKNVPTAKAAPARAGDVWTWTALDSDSKLIVSYLVGGRDSEYALEFMDDLRTRLASRVHLNTDGHKAYLQAVDEAVGIDIDYAMLMTRYGEGQKTEARYSSAVYIGAHKENVVGNPDRAHISSSYVERSNLGLRTHNRRSTRLTNAHGKKFENPRHMISLYTVWYNYARINSAVKMAPAMAAGISTRLWEMANILKLVDDAAGPAKKHGPYKPRLISH
jgi:IS1 family transposase